jgi:hypothetical protein
MVLVIDFLGGFLDWLRLLGKEKGGAPSENRADHPEGAV